jgi:hypothetical protein
LELFAFRAPFWDPWDADILHKSISTRASPKRFVREISSGKAFGEEITEISEIGCVCVFCNFNLQQEMATAVAMCAMQSSSSSVVVGAHSMTTSPQGAASTTPVSVAGPFRTQVNIFTPGFFKKNLRVYAVVLLLFLFSSWVLFSSGLLETL